MVTKTNPVSVRFDIEKVKFIKLRESLTTHQKVIDFLLNYYYENNKENGYSRQSNIQPEQSKPSTIEELKNIISIKPQKNYFTQDEPDEPYESPNDYNKNYNTVSKDFDYFLKQIKDLEYEEECKDFVARVNASRELSGAEKKLLIERLKSKWL